MPGSSMVSVVIPNYNHAQYVGDAIRSVLAQDYGPVEIIVVDDGSTDNSRQVIAEFEDRVHYIWQENQGLSAARNVGITAANGAFIGLLDADDLYEPNFLSTLVALLESDPQAQGAYCGYRFVDHLDNPLPQGEARLLSDGQLYQVLLEGNFLVPESMLVRRHCYEEVGLFDESLTACEDWDMWLRITSQYKVIGTNRVLTRHRVLPGSMSANPDRMYKNRMVVLAKHLGPIPENEIQWSEMQKKAYGCGYLTSAVEYLQYHEQHRAFECLVKMAELCPMLLTQLTTYYELALGDQKKGTRGHFATLDMEHNTDLLLNLLDRLFQDPGRALRLQAYRQLAYATSCYALALLSYGARDLRKTRHYLVHSLRFGGPAILNRSIVILFAKTLLGVRLLEYLRHRYSHVPMRS